MRFVGRCALDALLLLLAVVIVTLLARELGWIKLQEPAQRQQVVTVVGRVTDAVVSPAEAVPAPQGCRRELVVLGLCGK